MFTFRSCLLPSLLVGSSLLISSLASAIEELPPPPFFTLFHDFPLKPDQNPLPCPGVLIKTPQGLTKGLVARTCESDNENIPLINESVELIPLKAQLSSDGPLIPLTLGSVHDNYILININVDDIPDIQPAYLAPSINPHDSNIVEVVSLNETVQTSLIFFASVYTLANAEPPLAGRLVTKETNNHDLIVIGITTNIPNDVSIITTTALEQVITRQKRDAEFMDSTEDPGSGEKLLTTTVPLITLAHITSTTPSLPVIVSTNTVDPGSVIPITSSDPMSTQTMVEPTSAPSDSMVSTTVAPPSISATLPTSTPLSMPTVSTSISVPNSTSMISSSMISSTPTSSPIADEQNGASLAEIITPYTVVGAIAILYTGTGVVTNVLSYGGFSDSKALRWAARLGLYGLSALVEGAYHLSHGNDYYRYDTSTSESATTLINMEGISEATRKGMEDIFEPGHSESHW